jgi:RNA polymerase sigma-70 factor, ECF subfamily
VAADRPDPARTDEARAAAHDVGAELPDMDPVPSFDEIAVRYGPTVYQMAYRLTGDDEAARDLAQDVFVRVYRNLDKYEPGTFTGWLYRITKNLFLDSVRRRRRIRFEPLPEEDWRQPVDDGPGPEARLEQGMLRGDIEEAILQLPPTFRTAVVMCDVQGLTYDEISHATGWPLGTVRSRIHRGRRLLREALERDRERDDA